MEERYGDTPYFTPPYRYAAENSSLVEKAVKASAGATLNIRLDH